MTPAAQRAFLSLGTVLATLLYAVDTTIVNVALPHMQGTLQATQDQVSWVITSYIVASAIATPLAGWLGMRYGLRAVLGLAVAGFTVSSVLCGLANGLGTMVVARAVQGIFGAALIPLSQVALLGAYPQEKHGKVMAVWSLGVMVGPVMGPTLGGWLTEEFSWRWAFLINVPFGVVALAALWRGLAGGHDASRTRPFDWLGFALLSLALACFQLMLDRGHTLDWFSSTEIVTEAFLAVLLFYMFVVHSLTTRHAFVDPSLFRDLNLTVSLALMFMVGLSILSPTVLIPTFLQTIQGYPASDAGMIQASRGFGAIVGVLVAGRLTGRVAPRVIITAGVCVAIASLLMFGAVSVDTPRSYMVWASFVNGISTPLVFVTLSVAAFSTLRADQRAEAGGMLTLIRTMGSSIGVSVAVSWLARSAQANQSYLVEHFTPYSTDRWQSLGFEPAADANTAHLVAEIGRQATAIAYVNDFYLLAVATLLVLPLAWLVRGRASGASARSNAATLAEP